MAKRIYEIKNHAKRELRKETTVQNYLNDLPAEASKENALYYLDKFERYIVATGIAANLDELMEKRKIDPQGHVTHWQIRHRFLLSGQMASVAYSTLKNASACIANYYAVNNQPLQSRKVKFEKKRKIQTLPAPMTLQQIRHLIMDGKPNAELRAILLVALQSGMGRGEIFDSFGKDGLRQLMAAFGPDVAGWDFDNRIPLRVDVVRKKTGIKYYTFLSRDGLEAIKAYCLDRERRSGRKLQPTDRLFELPKFPAVFTTNLRNLAIRAGLNGDYVNPSKSKYAKRYVVHLHALRALFKTVCADAGLPEAVSEFMSGRDYQLYNYNQQPYLVDADGNKVGEAHFREFYAKIAPRLNILSGIDEQRIDEKVKAATEGQAQELDELRQHITQLQDQFRFANVQMATCSKCNEVHGDDKFDGKDFICGKCGATTWKLRELPIVWIPPLNETKPAKALR